jgi:hypothetical protein
MNKVALIYTGHLRTWDKCKDNHYKNIITGNCKLFWHTYEANPGQWYCTQIAGEYYKIEPGTHRYDAHRRPETSVANTLNQWHNNFVGFAIVPNYFDVYVRMRADITFSGKIDFDSYDYSGNNIYIPQGHNYYDGVNDQMAFGSYEVMKKYYSVYLHHLEIYQTGKIFHTEGYVTENLKRQGVNIVRLPIDNYVIRE